MSITEERERISELGKTVEERADMLRELMRNRLTCANNSEQRDLFTTYPFVNEAICLYDRQKEFRANGKVNVATFFNSYCRLFNLAADTFFSIFDAADFYMGLRQIDLSETPAEAMTCKYGLIDTLDSNKEHPVNLIRDFRRSELDNCLLPRALYTLETLLASLCPKMKERLHGINTKSLSGFFYTFKNATEEEIAEIESYPDYNDFRIDLDRIAIDLKNLQTALRLKEHEIYDRHPEWEVKIWEDPEHPFQGHEYRRNLSAALHAYYEKYGNPLEEFEEISSTLTCKYKFDKATIACTEEGFLPFPIITRGVDLDGNIEESAPRDISAGLKELLSTPVHVQFESCLPLSSPQDNGLAERDLNPWIADAKKRMQDALHAYCHNREGTLPSDSIYRELFKRKAVELLSSVNDIEKFVSQDTDNPQRDFNGPFPSLSPSLSRYEFVKHGPDTQPKHSNTGEVDVDKFAEKVAAKLRDEPIDARLVDVAPSAGKDLRAALKDPGGRPKKANGGADVMTQAEMAVAFGEPCNESMVANWEARAAGKKRGANPPDAIYNGERIIYSAELRLNPTPDNKKRLTALIAEFQSRHRIKEAIGEKARHFKSPETLAKASGQVASAIRERNQLKYEK